MSSKYIIKNCPACCNYKGKYGCEDNHDKKGRDTYCKCITDCIMKRIVNHCKDIEEYSDDYYTRPILELLDIQEVE